MSTIWERYENKWTDLSLKELANFAMWMNRVIGHHPTIIGGWAVYLYSPVMGSRDIDVLLLSREMRDRVITLYLVNNGYELRTKGFGEQEWVKYLEPGNPASDIYLDVCTEQDRNIVHGTEIEVPWSIANRWQRRRRFRRTDIFIPAPEPLLVLKAKAAWDRSYELTKTGRDYYRDKLRKDRLDILSLVSKCRMNHEIIAEIVLKSGFAEHFADVMGRAISDEDVLTRHGLDSRKLKEKIGKLMDAVT